MTKIGLPLEGVRVIEYANFVAAPICGRLLADWGAEVIKIEPIIIIDFNKNKLKRGVFSL